MTIEILWAGGNIESIGKRRTGPPFATLAPGDDAAIRSNCQRVVLTGSDRNRVAIEIIGHAGGTLVVASPADDGTALGQGQSVAASGGDRPYGTGYPRNRADAEGDISQGTRDVVTEDPEADLFVEDQKKGIVRLPVPGILNWAITSSGKDDDIEKPLRGHTVCRHGILMPLHQRAIGKKKRSVREFSGAIGVSSVEMTDDQLLRTGWKPFFQQQVADHGATATKVARVSSHHGIRVLLLGEAGEFWIPVQSAEAVGGIAVGDWVVLDAGADRVLQRLERKTVLFRKAAGEEVKPQIIAANIDTLFITTSCNEDFNLSRIERYLALALDAGIRPIVVLTKVDLSDSADEYRRQAEAASSRFGG